MNLPRWDAGSQRLNTPYKGGAVIHVIRFEQQSPHARQ